MTAAAQLCTVALRHVVQGLPVALAWQRATTERTWSPAARRLGLVTFTAAVRRTQEQRT